ncbi:MAG: hypothetical protein ACRCYO_09600 [Bacteroidia bacterium]
MKTPQQSKTTLLLFIFFFIGIVGFSQSPLVKQTLAYRIDNTDQASKKQVNYPSMDETAYTRLESKRDELKSKKSVLEKLSRSPTISDAAFDSLCTIVDAVEQDIKMLDVKIDSLDNTIIDIRINNYIRYLKNERTFGALFSPACPIHIAVPNDSVALYYNSRYKNGIRSKAFYAFIYGSESNWSALNNISIQGQGKQASLYTEIASGLIGPFRVGLSVQVAKSDTIKVNEARQRLMNGGGNTNIDLQFPLFFSYRKWRCTYVYSSIKASGDIPQFGTNTERSTGSLNSGLELYQDISTDNKMFNFYLSARASWIVGFSKVYYENLGIKQMSGLMPYGQLSMGFTLFGTYRFSIFIPLYAPDQSMLNVPATFGGQVLPFIQGN